MSKMIDLTNMTFDRLKVESFAYTHTTKSGQRVAYWNCICECGNHKVIRGTALKSGYTRSCGCFRKETLHDLQTKDLTEQRFGKLVAKKLLYTNEQRRNVWLCECDCGNFKEVTSDLLVSKHTQSCGCIGASVGELAVECAVKKLGLKYKREIEFDDLRTQSGRTMRFDFGIFNEEELIALVEYQGIQHYKENDYGFGELQRTVTDPAKRAYCTDKKIPLFEIKYSDNVEYEILDMLFTLLHAHDNSVPSADDNCEGVTTIRKEQVASETLASEAPCPCLYQGDDIVYSAKKYRETDGVKVCCSCFFYGL